MGSAFECWKMVDGQPHQGLPTRGTVLPVVALKASGRRAQFLDGGDKAARARCRKPQHPTLSLLWRADVQSQCPRAQMEAATGVLRRLGESGPRGLHPCGYAPGSGTAGPYGHPILNVLRNLRTVSRVAAPHSHQRRRRAPLCLHPASSLSLVVLFLAVGTDVRRCLSVVLICASLMTSDGEHACLLAI